jgi:hypothetical protein
MYLREDVSQLYSDDYQLENANVKRVCFKLEKNIEACFYAREDRYAHSNYHGFVKNGYGLYCAEFDYLEGSQIQMKQSKFSRKQHETLYYIDEICLDRKQMIDIFGNVPEEEIVSSEDFITPTKTYREPEELGIYPEGYLEPEELGIYA